MKKFAQIVAQIPPHLRQYVVEQDYTRYTAIDQATWRFILRQLKSFLSKNAHHSYVDGLAKTGISVEEIPHIDVMCEKLQDFGWTAVPVSGFIPPAAFMELQSLSVLPIASDMRTLDHILYTPAPDIVHEAAGHAPILVDPQFASYLKEYAQVAKKAIISSEDLAQYEAIRDLSDIKEDPASTPQQIAAAEKKLSDITTSMSHVSEATLLGRMNWWTAEYGLIGDLNLPKIFGAGLLSSVSEARNALSPKVRKVPLSIECVDVSYDITEQQPQLFVAQTFADLSRVLKQLEERLAFRRGGTYGLDMAKQSATVNTVELNSGLQISGRVTDVYTAANGETFYYKLTGPSQLCEGGRQLPGHGKNYHSHGFSSPLGLLKDSNKCLSEFNATELAARNLVEGRNASLSFASGVVVEGQVTQLTPSSSGKLMIVTFKNATAKRGNEIFFQPDWGNFDMAVGSQVTSVYAGPADRTSYGLTDIFPKKEIPRRQYSDQELLKQSLYQQLRDIRENKKAPTVQNLDAVAEQLNASFPNEWLAYMEILELGHKHHLSKIKNLASERLKEIQTARPATAEYIDLGLDLVSRNI